MLQRDLAADMAMDAGGSRLHPMLNARGGFESEVTVARLALDSYLVVTGSGQAAQR